MCFLNTEINTLYISTCKRLCHRDLRLFLTTFMEPMKRVLVKCLETEKVLNTNFMSVCECRKASGSIIECVKASGQGNDIERIGIPF